MASLTHEKTHVDEELAALANNVSAVLSVTASVERTLGPKGLDTMLVDRFGDVLVTNSGVTILERMEISHPAARMLVNVAKAQHEQIGDGTTTASVIAGALLKEGLNQISRGVPVSKLLEGIQSATQKAMQILKQTLVRPMQGLKDPAILGAACTAGRGDTAMAQLILKAAETIGEKRLREPSFKFAESMVGRQGADDELLEGVVVNKNRLSPLMPSQVSPAVILVLEDSLLPEEIEEESLRTESGFRKSLDLKTQFLENLRQLLSLGVNAIFTEGGIHSEAEEFFTHAGLLAARRLSPHDLQEIAAHTDAKPLKRSSLNRDPKSLQNFLGHAEKINNDEKQNLILIGKGKGNPRATLVVGASTKAVTEEKERKAKDAACALQAALQHGIVPGGGAAELSVARILEQNRNAFKAMTSYGLDCVLEGLKKPFIQMAANAGFNPLEKAEEVLLAQKIHQKNSISLNFETGAIADMETENIMDPAAAKIHALQSASEVAQAILRINRIIKMRENGNASA